MDKIIIYAIVGAVVGAFIGVICYFAKKEGKKLDEMLATTTDEQKSRLTATEVSFVEGKNNEWYQEGMIADMVDKGNKYAVKILWYNKVLQNAEYEKITFGDTSLSKEDAEKNNIKVGDFVKVYIAPEKTVGCFKIVF
jgi:hypothetical protein